MLSRVFAFVSSYGLLCSGLVIALSQPPTLAFELVPPRLPTLSAPMSRATVLLLAMILVAEAQVQPVGPGQRKMKEVLKEERTTGATGTLGGPPPPKSGPLGETSRGWPWLSWSCIFLGGKSWRSVACFFLNRKAVVFSIF